MTHSIGLAAQTIPGIPPARLIELARIGGFDRLGLAVDPQGWSPSDIATVRRALADEGVVLQDTEVIRLHDRVTDDMRRQIAVAAELGAGWIITISLNEDAAATTDLLGELVAYAAGTGVSPILEFGRFTAVGSLAEACPIAERAGVPLLIDPLHLARSRGTADALRALPATLVPYAQLCDAGSPPEMADRAALLDEAREHRRDLGCGLLDLRAFVAALPPDLVLMNEVRSSALAATFPDAAAHARHLGQSMRRWLEGNAQ